MDQTANAFDRIFQYGLHESSQLSHVQQQNFTIFNNVAFPHYNDFKQLQRNQFFILSPKPFAKYHQPIQQFDLLNNRRKQIQRTQQMYMNSKLNLQEQQSFCRWFGNQKQNQIFYDQSSYMQKKNDQSAQFCFKFQKIENISENDQVKKQQFVKIQNICKAQIYSEVKMQNEQNSSKRYSKNQKGLKYLSNAVYNILKNKQKTTFNNVAKILALQLKNKALEQGKQFDQNQQKNVKRRAYDALNVMIAADIIEKSDKFIYLKYQTGKKEIKSPRNQKTSLKFNHKNEQLYQKQLNDKAKQIELKNILLQKMEQRKKYIQAFVQQKVSQKSILKEKINFPFLCIRTRQESFISVTQGYSPQKRFHCEQKQNSSTCAQYPQENCVYLNFRYCPSFQNLEIEGDTDLMAQMGKLIYENQRSLPNKEIQNLSLKE